jgi:hypothetical protein
MDIHWLRQRIEKDCVFAPRRREYRQMLEVARSQQYQAISLGEAAERLAGLGPEGERTPAIRETHSGAGEWAGQRVLALRHDVDTCNRRGVRLFLDLEQEFDATATYYFRLNTLGMTDLVREILASGSEVGYHFEEPATVAKQHTITSRQQLHKADNRKRIDDLMERNIRHVNAMLGTPVRSLCSHNDFYNRRLQFENYTLLSDHIRQKFNIRFAVNDRSFLALFDRYCSDVSEDAWLWYNGESPVKAMLEGVPRILVLTHPRQWHPAPLVNTRENLVRLLQELYFRARRV